MKANFTIKVLTLIILFSLSFNLSFSQNWGVGIKGGDPLGLSVKKYNGDKALELIIGQTYYWGNYNYGYYFQHDNRYKGKNYQFIKTYGYSRPIAIQLHYLIHKDISKFDGLKWYFGFGGQFRYSHYYYDYWDQNNFYITDKVTDLGIGADGVIGLEYTFDDVPISLALDAVLYMEIFDRPFLFLGQGGLAIRYNF